MAVAYRERDASTAALRPWLRCVWAVGPVGERRRAILPDGCMDVVWTGRRLVVAGPDTGVVVSEVAPGAVCGGVRFRPGAGAAGLGVAAYEVRDARVPLGDVWGRAGAELEERVAGAAGIPERIALIEDALGARVAPLDPLLLDAARRLEGGERVAAVAHDVALSERQLRRRFHDAVGYGPKTLARVLRLQRLLRLAGVEADAGLAALGAAAGYADQAHMAADCRRLTGLTPRELLRR